MSSFYGNLGGSGGGGGNANERVLTEEEYNALSEEEKMNNTTYYINDVDAGGEGGSGGHTILNDSGTELAQEDNLQFKGAYSKDNATSGTTEVNIYREMTKAEFDLLSNDEKKGFINIIDEPEAINTLIQPVIYSTEEREIGVWIDGKPLYQKTFIVDNPQAGGQNYNLNISNLEKVVEQFGTWTRRWEVDGVIQSFTYNINAENEIMPSFQPQFQVLARVKDTDGTFYIYYPTTGAYSQAVSQIRLTIQYTKTTDTVGSGSWTPQGAPAIHYSTDEHVIGTWIDGSTLYEKTIDCGEMPSNSTKDVETLSNISKVIDIKGFAYGTAGSRVNSRPIPLASGGTDDIRVDVTAGVLKITTYGSWQSYSAYVTIQYTKSS